LAVGDENLRSFLVQHQFLWEKSALTHSRGGAAAIMAPAPPRPAASLIRYFATEPREYGGASSCSYRT